MNEQLNEKVDNLTAKVDALIDVVMSMKADIDTSKNFVEKISEEINPTLEALKNSSMFKMLLPKAGR